MLIGLLILFLIVGFVAPEYLLDLLATAVIFGVFAASADFSYGYAGIMNLGSALYFGLGAYIMGYGLKASANPFLLIPSALIVSIILSLVIGYVGFRVKASQTHFGLIGLAITLGFEQLAISLYGLTGGSNGITNVPRPVFSFFGLDLDLSSPTLYYFYVIVVSMGIFFILWRLVNTDFGRALQALRHDETKLETMGYHPLKVKMTVNAITAAIASLAGMLLVCISGIAYPSLFGVGLSMSVLIWVALGGTGSLIGPFIIAMILKLSESMLSSTFENSYTLIIGLVFVIMVIVAPTGVFGIGKKIFQYIKRTEVEQS